MLAWQGLAAGVCSFMKSRLLQEVVGALPAGFAVLLKNFAGIVEGKMRPNLPTTSSEQQQGGKGSVYNKG